MRPRALLPLGNVTGILTLPKTDPNPESHGVSASVRPLYHALLLAGHSVQPLLTNRVKAPRWPRFRVRAGRSKKLESIEFKAS